MTCNWPLVQANEFIEFNPKISLKKEEIAPKISMEDLTPFTKNIGSYSYAPYRGGSKFINGDILFARITPCLENGKTAYVDCLNEGEVGFGSTEFIVLRAIKQVSDPNFVYYLSISPQFRSLAIKSMVGSSGRQRVQLDALANYSFRLPPLSDQKKIANYLSSLDKKFFLNQRINDNLSKLMSLLFQIKVIKNPDIEKWNKLPLTDIANYKNGLAMQRYRPKEGEPGIPVLKIKELGQGTCSIDSEHCSEDIDKTVIVYDGDVIFSWSGTLLVKVWTGGKAGLNQHLFKVTSETYPKWFYFLWTLHHLENFVAIAAAKATTMGHIKRKDLELSEVFVPPKEEFDHLNKVFSPLLNKIIAIGIENRKLIEIRDLLLKKLMGELEANR